MEIKFKKTFSDLIYKEEKPFRTKREINWKFFSNLSIVTVVLVIMAVIIKPQSVPNQEVFHEKTQSGAVVRTTENNPTEQTVAQFQKGSVNLQNVHSSLDNTYAPTSGGGGQLGHSGGKERNASMILARSGSDIKNQLSAGTRIFIKLIDKIIVSTQALPLVGIITRDVTHDDELAIPQGSKVLGSVSFDDSSERANINLTNIIFPDGRERQISAVAIGADEQLGVEGNIKSKALQNTAGFAFSRFIGAYAQGSMSSGQLGAQSGGSQNGMKNAISATAEDRANAYADDMKKQKKWIELTNGTQFMAILNQYFIYREPGGTYSGR
jgi:type IV secretory pathway VirB10-like protein